jgi:hypothetical protein
VPDEAANLFESRAHPRARSLSPPLVAERPVEALDEGILDRATWADEAELDV